MTQPEPDEVREEQLQALFLDADSDGNGCIDASELKGWCRSQGSPAMLTDRRDLGSVDCAVQRLAELERLGLPVTDAFVNDVLQQYDKNGDGCIEFHEFGSYVQYHESSMRSVFDSLDTDGNGRISPEELLAALHKSGLAVGADDVQRMIALLDKDQSNEISYSEYRRFASMLPSVQARHERHVLYSWADSASWTDGGLEFRMADPPPGTAQLRLVIGGVAGGVSRTAMAPLERLRTLMMTQPNQSSMLGTARKMWADGGVVGLFRGNAASVAKVVPASAVQFAVYEHAKGWLRSRAHALRLSDGAAQKLDHLGAGCWAGAVSTAVVYPLETLRTNVAVGGGNGGYLQVSRTLWASRGLAGFYQGFGPGLVNSAASLGLSFTTYEALLAAYIAAAGRAHPSSGERGGLAGAGAMIVTMTTMPMEVVMRRMQVQGTRGNPIRYTSAWNCAATLVREEGWRCLWRGTASSCLKVAPTIGIVRYTYELLGAYFGVGGIRQYREARQ